MNLSDVVIVTNDKEYKVQDTPTLPVVVPYYVQCEDKLLPVFKDMILACWRLAVARIHGGSQDDRACIAGFTRGVLDLDLLCPAINEDFNLSELHLSILDRDFLHAQGLNPVTYFLAQAVVIWDTFIWVRNDKGILVAERWNGVDGSGSLFVTGATAATLQRLGIEFGNQP